MEKVLDKLVGQVLALEVGQARAGKCIGALMDAVELLEVDLRALRQRVLANERKEE